MICQAQLPTIYPKPYYNSYSNLALKHPTTDTIYQTKYATKNPVCLCVLDKFHCLKILGSRLINRYCMVSLIMFS